MRRSYRSPDGGNAEWLAAMKIRGENRLICLRLSSGHLPGTLTTARAGLTERARPKLFAMFHLTPKRFLVRRSTRIRPQSLNRSQRHAQVRRSSNPAELLQRAIVDHHQSVLEKQVEIARQEEQVDQQAEQQEEHEKDECQQRISNRKKIQSARTSFIRRGVGNGIRITGATIIVSERH
jgi:hypothetical protein